MSEYLPHSFDTDLYRALLWGIGREWSNRDPADATLYHSNTVTHPDPLGYTPNSSDAVAVPVATRINMTEGDILSVTIENITGESDLDVQSMTLTV
jgi:hypothetical protein